jgi:hypothetical protein
MVKWKPAPFSILQRTTLRRSCVVTLTAGCALGSGFAFTRPAVAEDVKGYTCESNTRCTSGEYQACKVVCNDNSCVCEAWSDE